MHLSKPGWPRYRGEKLRLMFIEEFFNHFPFLMVTFFILVLEKLDFIHMPVSSNEKVKKKSLQKICNKNLKNNLKVTCI